MNPYVDNVPWIRSVPFIKKGYVSEFEAASNLDRGNTRSSWNAFQHYKRNASLSSGSVVLPIDIYSGAWPVRGHTIWYPDVTWHAQLPYHESLDVPPFEVAKLYDETSLDGPVVAPPGWDGYLSPMKAYMLNQAAADTSLLNALYELKDFRTLKPTLGRARKTLEQYLNILPKVVGPRWLHAKSYYQAFQRRFRNRRCTLRDVMRSLAELHLTWGFALAPLIADLDAIEKAFSVAADRIDKIYRHSGERRLVRYKRHLGDSSFPPYMVERSDAMYSRHSHPYPEGVPGLRGEKIVSLVSKATLHGQMEYTQWAPGLEKRQALLYGLLDQLGINLNPSIIWNGIPYSFIVDWFVRVSDALDQFKIELVQPTTVIHRCCYSFTVERITKRKVCFDIGGPWDSGWRTVSVVRESAYRRYSDNLGWVPSSTSGLSGRETALSTSLVVVKWPRRRKR